MALAREETLNKQEETDSDSQDNMYLEELLNSWANTSTDLIDALTQKDSCLLEGRKPKSIMALGAFKAHLSMAIQAKKAFESN